MTDNYDMMKKINQLMNAKEWKNALVNIDDLLSNDLDTFLKSEVLHKKGVCQYYLEDYCDAIKCFNKSWNINEYFITHNLYDKAYFEVYHEHINKAYFLVLYKEFSNLEDDKKALIYLRKVSRANLDNKEYPKKYLELDKDLFPLYYYKKLININPNDLFAAKWLCNYYYNRSNYNQALKYVNMALKIDEHSLGNDLYKDILNHANYKTVYKYHLDEAHQLYNVLLKEDYYSKDEYESIYNKLIYYLSEASRINIGVLVIKGFMLNSIGDFKEAEKSFDLYLSGHHNDTVALLGKIQALIYQKRFNDIFVFYNEWDNFNYRPHLNQVSPLCMGHKDSKNLIKNILKEFRSEEEILVKGLYCMFNFDFENAIIEFDKLKNDYNLKAQLLFSLHEYDQAVNAISNETEEIIKFKEYCKNKEHTGFFGVFKSNLDNYNWEYVYINSGLFKRLMATTMEELKFKVDRWSLIWKNIDSDIAYKSYKENKIIRISKSELIYGFGEDYNESIPPDIISDDCRIKGYSYCLNGDYEKAIAEFNKGEINSILLNNLGYAYLKLEKYDEALKYFNKGLKLDCEDHVILFNKIFTYLKMGDYFKAGEIFKNFNLVIVDDFDYELADYLFNLAQSLVDKKQFEDSIYCFDMCIKLLPKRGYYYNGKAVALNELKNYNEAIKNYDIALDYESNNNIILFNKAYCLYDISEFNDSLSVINHSISSEYQYSPAWNLKGKILEELSIYDEAYKCYKKALELNNNENIYYILDLVNLLINCNRIKEALKYCEKTLEIDCENEIALYFKEECLKGLNN